MYECTKYTNFTSKKEEKMKHFVSRVLAIGLTGPCCLQVVLLNLLAASAPLRTKRQQFF